MSDPALVVCNHLDALAIKATDFIIEKAREAVRERGRFVLALAGGATPEQTYAHLVHPEHRTVVPWSKTYVFFSDERFVSHADARSNYAVVRRSLLADATLGPSQVFPVRCDTDSAAAAATAYAAQMAVFFGLDVQNPPPRFDLILLGMGSDGHTASLFPHAPALHVNHAWVTSSGPGKLPPQVDRITFTFPLINAARHVAFLVSGERKAPALGRIFAGQTPREEYPAAGVHPVDGTLTWFVDPAAAKHLPC